MCSSDLYLATTLGATSLIFLYAFETLAVTTVMATVTRDLDGRSWYSVAFSLTLASSVVGTVVGGLVADRRGARDGDRGAGIAEFGEEPGGFVQDRLALGFVVLGSGAGHAGRSHCSTTMRSPPPGVARAGSPSR